MVQFFVKLVHIPSTGTYWAIVFPLQERHPRVEYVARESLNFTEEILSATSFSRQLAEQMILAKAYVIIAKEYNNLYSI